MSSTADPAGVPGVGGDAPRSGDDLLIATAEGDTATSTALYDRMAGLVAHNVHRMLGDASPPHDVIRSIFLEICRDTSGFDPGKDSATTWVLASMHRHVADLVPTESNCPAQTNETGR